jgi:predicted ribosome quality control (RQC) complex YloA/Tae2 family protein
MPEIELDSFYKENEKVTIALDPDLTPEQNMKKYYRRCTKAKKAYGLIEAQLIKNNEEQDYLLSIANSIEKSDTIEELAEIRKELANAAYIRPAPPKKGSKQTVKIDKESRLPPRIYTSVDGFTILIGRNNRQNDALTLKIAQDHDIWLHAQKIPGSHVIIRTEGKPVPQTTLAEAAAYAAFFSKAGAGDNVPVDYTTCDQVKKPNGAKPGMVIYFKQKTLYVTPKEPSG